MLRRARAPACSSTRAARLSSTLLSMQRRTFLALSILIATSYATLGGCGGDASDGEKGATKRFAYVTNGVDPFWNVCAAGARAAEKELGVDVEVVFPDGIADQKQKIEDLLVRGLDGLAVSPIDAANMTAFLDEVAGRTVLVTHDSDAPDSQRRCFIGVDNYAAGLAAGRMLREALPNGGEVALFVGRMEQANSRLRRQGVIDALLGREPDATRADPLDGSVSGGGFTIVATRTDNFDKAQAKANAEDVLIAHPNLAGMVGLFAYNAPACLEALRGAGKLGAVKIASFDEQIATLDGITSGHVVGTVSQSPFQYGYRSVVLLEQLARGDASGIPAGGWFVIEPTVVTTANVAEFRTKLEADMAAGAR
jgi:ribose transport system substrate-binding protein